MKWSIKEITLDLYKCYENLSQNYEAEFSPLTGKRPNHNGLYEITPLDPNHQGFMMLDNNNSPLGFAVVTHGQPRWDIAEFYVIPTERRKKIGRELAFAIFDKFNGPWQVRQISGADHAHHFWVDTIAEYTNGKFTNEVQSDLEWGTVRIQMF